MSQSTAKVISGRCLHFMGFLPKMKKSGQVLEIYIYTYAGVTALPKRKVASNKQRVSNNAQRQTKQPNLEAVQTLLQQVQDQLNGQTVQPKPRKTNNQTIQSKKNIPIVVHSDNDDDFLFDSASTETLTQTLLTWRKQVRKTLKCLTFLVESYQNMKCLSC